jgi:hypothetical protein
MLSVKRLLWKKLVVSFPCPDNARILSLDMTSWHRRIALIGLVLTGQAAILILALLIGVLDPPIPQKAAYRHPAHDSNRQQREKSKEAAKQLARFNRMQKSTTTQSISRITELTHPSIDTAMPDTEASLDYVTSSLEASLQSSIGQSMQGVLGSSAQLPLPDPVQFLGAQIRASRIIILVDVSASVKTKLNKAGMPITELREELIRLIEQLGPNHLFGIIQFTRKWDAFSPELLPATASVKSDAINWMRQSFRTTGTSGRNWINGTPNGIEAVLKQAFSMNPQVDQIILLSDGDFQRSLPQGGGQDVPWDDLRRLTKSLQDQNLGQAQLRLICYLPPANVIPYLRNWAKENGDAKVLIHGQD